MIAPLDAANALVERLSPGRLEAREGQQDAARQTRPEARSVGDLEGGAEAHPGVPGAQVLCAQTGELAVQQGHQVAGGGGEKRRARVGHSAA